MSPDAIFVGNTNVFTFFLLNKSKSQSSTSYSVMNMDVEVMLLLAKTIYGENETDLFLKLSFICILYQNGIAPQLCVRDGQRLADR